MTDRVGLLARSTLMLYEIVELEPTPPAPVLQFDYIRTVMRQEATLADAAKGIMGNAQEPILVLPNIWLFANAAQNPAYLDLDDCTILSGLAGFLGGDPDVLVPAWRSMYLNLHDIPADLPEKLRGARLQAESAGLIPGGPQRYLDIMAEFVDSRLRILRACGRSPSSRDDIRITLRESVEALRDWWNVHKYVFDGATTGFSIDFTHDGLKRPIAEYLQSNVCETDVAELAVQLVDDCALSIEESRSIVHW